MINSTNKYKYLFSSWVFILLILSIISCSEDKQVMFPPFFYVDKEIVTVPSITDSITVGVATNIDDWSVEVLEGAEWLTVKKYSGMGSNYAAVFPDDNLVEEPRFATIVISGMMNTFKVVIEQDSYEPPPPPGFKDLKNEVAGNLRTLLEEHDKGTITNLTLSGVIDYRDLEVLREMLLNESLTHINIGNTTIESYDTYKADMIPKGTFKEVNNLESIILPNTLQKIGVDGFSYSLGLDSIVLPNSVVELEQGAFYNCRNLEHVVLSNSLEKISRYTFGNSKIKKLDIPASLIDFFDIVWGTYVTEINVHPDHPNNISIDGVVYNKGISTLVLVPPGLTEYTSPAIITEVATGAFIRNFRLETVILQNIKTVNWRSFQFCRKLETVVMDNVEFLANYAFDGSEIANLNETTFTLDISKAKSVTFGPTTVPILMTPHLKDILVIKVASEEIKSKFNSINYPNIVVVEE